MTRTTSAPERPIGPPARPAGPGVGPGRGPMAAMGMPTAKAMSFGFSLCWLLGRLAPERGMLDGDI